MRDVVPNMQDYEAHEYGAGFVPTNNKKARRMQRAFLLTGHRGFFSRLGRSFAGAYPAGSRLGRSPRR